jgi:AraC-like DNA-binding protein
MTQRLSDQFGLYVSVSFARGLMSEVARRGLDTAELLAGSELSQALLDDPRARLSCDAWDELVARALRMSGDPSVGLTLGQNAPIQMFQLAGWLSLSAGTVRKAIALLRYAQPLLANHVTLQLTERGADAHLFYDQVALDPDAARVGADFGIAALYRFGLRLGLPQGFIREIWFRHAEPEYAAEYARLFGCTIRYRRARNAIVFDRALLAHVNPAADELMQRLLAQHAESLLSGLGPSSLATQIQVVLLQEDALTAVDSTELAARLGTSARALRWQLSRDGHSLRRLVDEVRFFIARRTLCRDDGATIHELAERLGFSEASAFYRAFKRWTGETPAAFVERERASAAALSPEIFASRESGVWMNPLVGTPATSAMARAMSAHA